MYECYKNAGLAYISTVPHSTPTCFEFLLLVFAHSFSSTYSSDLLSWAGGQLTNAHIKVVSYTTASLHDLSWVKITVPSSSAVACVRPSVIARIDHLLDDLTAFPCNATLSVATSPTPDIITTHTHAPSRPDSKLNCPLGNL